VSLAGTMTVVGGVLWLLDGAPAADLGGLALPALVEASAPASIDAIFNTREPLDHARWKGIVIHHSGSPVGTPASIAAQHSAMNLRGLGHHFVIGNGRGAPDGEIHVGYRWLDQLPGAHVGGPEQDWYNHHTIGICLIGDGQRHAFSDAQIRRLVNLVRALARELEIPEDRIVLHSDIVPTQDPGRFFPAAAFREGIASAR
jgi:hypothetical protein